MKCANCDGDKDTHIYPGGICTFNTPEQDVEAYQAYQRGETEEQPETVSFYKPEYPKYLNVYEVNRVRGGSEEGGWWYDVGEPLESVRVDNKDQELLMYAALLMRYDLNVSGEYWTGLGHEENFDLDIGRVRGRYSAAGGYDVCIHKEYEFAQPFPKKRPRYE